MLCVMRLSFFIAITGSTFSHDTGDRKTGKRVLKHIDEVYYTTTILSFSSSSSP